jgi:thiamine-monophosphate kinase
MGESEFDFIRRLRRREEGRSGTPKNSSPITRHSSLLKGIGDDAAVFRQRAGFDTVITADLLVEGIDFELGSGGATARDVGHKALAVSLSDVAAMGARPTMCLLSVGLTRERWRTGFLGEFYGGVGPLAERYGVSVVGGDISRTPERVVVDSVVLGEVRKGRAVLRSGARAGDQIFVTGSLGGAAAGLSVLRERAAGARLTRAEGRLVRRQLRPEPRVEWGRRLCEERLASAMIDLSDGLSSDLAHLCRESGVGASVEAESLPLDPLLKSLSLTETEALSLALDGGEDFELLFTVPAKRAARVPAELGGVRVTRVGEVTDDPKRLTLVREGRARRLRPRGFEHFGASRR